MSYTLEQFEKTKQYIHKFFYSRSDKNNYLTLLQEFTKHLDSTFQQIDIFKPEIFKFSKDSVFMPGFSEWISENIEPFPEDLTLVLTKAGDSYRECEGNKIMIFRAPLALPKKQDKFSFEDLNLDTPFIPYNYNMEADPYSFYTPSASTKVNTTQPKLTLDITTISSIDSDSSSDNESTYSFIKKDDEPEHDMFFEMEDFMPTQKLGFCKT